MSSSPQISLGGRAVDNQIRISLGSHHSSRISQNRRTRGQNYPTGGSVVPMSDSSLSYGKTALDDDMSQYLAKCFIPPTEIITEDEWLVENTMEFFNVLYLAFAHMTAENDQWNDEINPPQFPSGVKFLWRVKQFSKPIQLPVVKYIQQVFLWAEDLFMDERFFPTDSTIPFPEQFRSKLNIIFKRLFRVYAIILHNEELFERSEVLQIKRSLKEFLYFGWFWKLITVKDVSNILDTVVTAVRIDYNAEISNFSTSKTLERRK